MEQPWWITDKYDRDTMIPGELIRSAGPMGPAVVAGFPDGSTQRGWGRTAFMKNYSLGKFDYHLVRDRYQMGRCSATLLMRSFSVIAIDIDGKNNGFEGIKMLGPLPETLAETSRSGNGYHLFYKVDVPWHPSEGFKLVGDKIGIHEGVDIRDVGCIYHWKHQRWNDRDLAEFPDYLLDPMVHRVSDVAKQAEAILATLQEGTPEEVAVMQNDLAVELEKPIAEGKRNTTLFAIGSQMFLAKVPMWDAKVYQRALDIGLDDAEAVKLVNNIRRYAK